jgi:integrase
LRLFIERHVRRSNRQRSAKGTEGLLRHHVLPYWHGRPIGEVTRRDILDVLDRVVDAGTPIAANRTLAAIRKMFRWAVERDIIATSPCINIKPPAAERSRDRTLSDEELRQVWQAADKIGYPFGSVTKMLALTGQRRDEVSRMTWEEVDLKKRVWRLPAARTKNGRPHEVPLSTTAISILKAAPRLVSSPYVFTTNGATPASGFAKNKKRLDGLLPADMPPWRLHDLRRTVASGLARLGVGLPVVEKILNHTSGTFKGVLAVYQKYDFRSEREKALQLWGQHVDALVSAQPDKAQPLRGAHHG